MPPKKTSFKKRKRSTKYGKRKSFRKKSTYKKIYPMYSSICGLPITKTVSMPYHMEFVTSTAGIAYNTFRSNSIYDPDYTGGGHQPRSHDQWATYYKYYRVLACSIRATFFWDTIPSQSHCVGVYIDDNATFAYSSSLDLYEKEGSRYTKPLLPSSLARTSIYRKLNMSRLSNKALKDQRTEFNSNPSMDGPLIHVWTLPNNTGALTYGAVRVHVALAFRVQMFEPLDVLGS